MDAVLTSICLLLGKEGLAVEARGPTTEDAPLADSINTYHPMFKVLALRQEEPNT